MDSAPRANPPSTLRLFLAVLAIATLVGDSGCARLRSFRSRQAEPAFGVDPLVESPEFPGDEIAPQAGTDYYATHMNRARGRGEPSEGGRGPTLEPSRTLASSRSAESSTANASTKAPKEPPVALQTPVTLSPLPDPATRTDAATAGVEPRVGPASPTPIASVSPPKPRQSSDDQLGTLIGQARATLDGLNNYQVRMNHQQRVEKGLEPAEDVVLSIRRNPKSVRLEWLEGPNKGREVLYSAQANGGLMHVRMPGPLGAALPRISLAPDGPLAMRNSRHPISEAGFDTIVGNLEKALDRKKGGTNGTEHLSYGGLEQPEGLERPAHKLIRKTPNGETWTVYLDSENHLPSMVHAQAGDGTLLERFVFGNPRTNLADLASDNAFDPDSRWGPAKGLLGRLARSAAGGANANPTETR